MRYGLVLLVVLALSGCASFNEGWDRVLQAPVPDLGTSTRTNITCIQRSPGVVSCY
jgi:hypothetical protein